MEKYNGKIEKILYRNSENGYTVFKFITDDYDELICNGSFISIEENDYLELQGDLVLHEKYGLQLEVKEYFQPEFLTEKSIIAFLSSGVIDGIREKTAKKIVDRFGIETINILDNDPLRLAEVSGIGKVTFSKIIESYSAKRSERNVIMGLGKYGVSPNIAIKIFNKYGLNSLNKIKSNPYCLCKDIDGIGFKKADEIAKEIGMESDSIFRVEEGVQYVLKESISQGNTFLPYDDLVEKSCKILGVSNEAVEKAIYEQCIEGSLKLEDDDIKKVFLQKLYKYECEVAELLVSFLENEDKEFQNINIDNVIKNGEIFFGLKLAVEQRIAVETALSSGIMILTGGPGTGKTTIVKFILECFKELGLETKLCAPTGRAAKRLSESSNQEAFTIHRLLEVEFNSLTNDEAAFGKNKINPISADVIIVDETSMVDIFLMKSLLSACNKTAKILFIGDSDQLPSVGPGNVLSDMIKSEKIPTVRLTEIFRQSESSGIIANAHRVNHGESLITGAKYEDFFFMKVNNQIEGKNLVVDLIKNRLPQYFGVESIDIQVLTPVRKGELGVYSLNEIIQRNINPTEETKNEIEYIGTIFRVGDKVMQIKNDYEKVYINNNTLKNGTGVFNGDIGYIDAIDEKLGFVYVSFEDGRRVEYKHKELDNLELAYSITIHKSQGSEFDIVILPIIDVPFGLKSRNILYTAVTRAKKAIILVGNAYMIDKMIKSDLKTTRYSSLKERIVKLYDFRVSEI